MRETQTLGDHKTPPPPPPKVTQPSSDPGHWHQGHLIPTPWLLLRSPGGWEESRAFSRKSFPREETSKHSPSPRGAGWGQSQGEPRTEDISHFIKEGPEGCQRSHHSPRSQTQCWILPSQTAFTEQAWGDLVLDPGSAVGSWAGHYTSLVSGSPLVCALKAPKDLP